MSGRRLKARSRYAFAIVSFLVGAAPMATAVPGDVDGSFGGGDGVATFDSGGADSGFDVLVAPDRKVVVVGETYAGGQGDFAAARFTRDGLPDASFSNDGLATTDFFGADDTALAGRVLSDGRILVVGYVEVSDGGPYRIGIARYRPNGRLDDSFGGDGKVAPRLPDEANAFDVVVTGGGSFVVAAEHYPGGSSDFALVKYRADGRLDRDFGNDGMRFTDFAGGSDYVDDIALQEGRLLVLGSTRPSGGDRAIALARYMPNGRLDQSFGGDGRRTFDFLTGDDTANGLEVLPSGKFVTSPRYIGSSWDLAVARFNPNGSLDTGFGSSGFGVLETPGNQFSADVVVIDGRLYAVGDGSAVNQMGAARFLRGGSVDTSFGGGDGFATAVVGNDARPYAGAVQGGKLLVGGSAYFNMNEDFAVARFLT